MRRRDGRTSTLLREKKRKKWSFISKTGGVGRNGRKKRSRNGARETIVPEKKEATRKGAVGAGLREGKFKDG